MTIQQGDLLLRSTVRRWDGYSPGKRAKVLTLAKGEATGHSHVLECEESDAELIAQGEYMLLTLGSPGVLKHEEHGAIEVPEGTYEVAQVREFDVAENVVRIVRD